MRGSIATCAVRLLAACFVAAACTSSPPTPGISDADLDGAITTAIGRMPPQIDPQRSGDSEQIRHSAMVFEALMTFDPKTLTPMPAAAKDYPRISADGLTYTFTLRDGLTYSDGSPLRARDFVYAFSRVCDPVVRSPAAFGLHVVAGCRSLSQMDPNTTAADLSAARSRLGLRANGDTEIVFTLTEPASYFTALTATPLAYPVRESDVMKAGAAYGSQVAAFIGNGPFKLVEWKTDQWLIFERNDNYRNPAKLKRWTKVVVEPDARFAAYRNNEIDFFGGIPGGRASAVTENLEAIESDAKLRAQVVDAPSAYTDFFVLNVSRAPFNDRNVRQAFAKAIDRAALIKELTKSGEAAHSLIPPGNPGHDAYDRFQLFDPARARQLLQSSGFAGRPELSTIRLTYPSSDPGSRTPAEWLQQQLKRNLGIEIAIEAVDRLTWGQMVATPLTAPQIRFTRWLQFYPDPQGWLTGMFHSSAPIAAGIGYRNSEFDALVREADRESDIRRRADLYRRASRILSEDTPAIWEWWPANRYLRKPRVRGVTDSAIDFEYGLLRITEIYVTKKA
jgi:oligopeptide transport system substrate-binding protein